MPSSDAPVAPPARIFDQVVERYDEHAVLECEVGSRLLERLPFQRSEPGRILDIGSGTGVHAASLKRQYRRSEVIGLDASPRMCVRTRRQSGWRRPVRAVCADLRALPLADRSVDLLFSNLALQWSRDLAAVFAGFRRVLRPGGLLLFSSLGPDSLLEWRNCCSAIGQGGQPGAGFADMHDVGDALVTAGFAEPVMDSETITLSYRTLDALLQDLEATGASSHLPAWPPSAEFRDALRAAYQPLLQQGQYPLSWEIIYGAAFGPPEGQPIKGRDGDVATFSVDALRQSLKR